MKAQLKVNIDLDGMTEAEVQTALDELVSGIGSGKRLIALRNMYVGAKATIDSKVTSEIKKMNKKAAKASKTGKKLFGVSLQ